MPDRPTTALEVVEFQADACEQAGSPLYARILHGVSADLRAGGVSASLLDDGADDPFGSALALRFLGAVHRIVLEGRAPELAVHYPSAGGGAGAGDPVPAFLATLLEHHAEVERRLADGVQTNEVARSAVLVGGYGRVAQTWGLPLRILELGASAGLNLRFDAYAYDTGAVVAGDPTSPVRFAGVWEGPPPPLPARFDVAERTGCDRHPIDVTTSDGQLRLLSYVWPDQLERIDRLRAAIAVAQHVPAVVEAADAADWVEGQLARPRPGVATVVVHSIVLQYLPPERRRRVRAAIGLAGESATAAAPVAWLRMEPAGPHAELRLTTWPSGHDEVLAESGFHGPPIRWLA